MRSRAAWLGVALAALVMASGVVLPAASYSPASRQASAWTPSVPVSPEAVSSEDVPAVLVDPLGTTTVAWIGTDNDYFEHSGLVVRRKPAGQPWQVEQIVDPAGSVNAALVSDAGGNVTAAYGWSPGTSRSNYPYAITADATGTFGTPVRLSTEARIWQWRPIQLAVDPFGTSTALWVAVLPNKQVRVAVARRPASGNWQPAQYVSKAAVRVQEAKLGVGLDGAVTVLWRGRGSARGPSPVWTRTLSDGRWSRTIALSDHGDGWGDDFQIEGGPNGAFYACWVLGQDTGLPHRMTATRKPNGTWTTP